MKSQKIEEWASAFIAYQEDSDRNRDGHPLFWAAADLMLPETPQSQEDCWGVILEVLSRAPSPEVIGVLAAGPLEDLIESAGPQFIARIEAEAKANPAFRHLLGGVWKSGTPEVWRRIEAARDAPW